MAKGSAPLLRQSETVQRRDSRALLGREYRRTVRCLVGESDSRILTAETPSQLEKRLEALSAGSATTHQSRSCAVCQTVTEHEILYQKWDYPILRCKDCRLGSAEVGNSFDTSTIYSDDYFQGRRK